MSAVIATEHPHVVRRQGTCGGSPIIRGTRIPVRLIAELWNAGETVEEIVGSYPHLKASWVHDGISYYLDHQAEIDREMEANRIEEVLAKEGAAMDEKGMIRFQA